MDDTLSPVGALLGLRDGLHDRQVAREATARQAATGVRALAILKGDLGPVLRRWVSASILPVSGRLRLLGDAILRGDMAGAAEHAQSAVFGLPDLTDSPDLHAVLRWALKGSHLDDLVLTVMGEVITACAQEGKPTPLTRVLTQAANKARETSIGQFLTQVQGAKTMLRVRRKGQAAWRQKKQLDAVAALMSGQIRSAVDTQEELGVLPIRGKVVVSVINQAGEQRRIDLRPPESDDWDLLNVARVTKGERDPHLGTWCAFVMLVLCCAQAEAGWFDLVKIARAHSLGKGNRRHRGAHGLVLSDSAHLRIKADIDKWLRLGFIKEPMLIEPVDGDYLTVKHRKVAGGRGPMGAKTNPEDTDAWRIAGDVMGGTAWTVPEGTLRALRESDFVCSLAEIAEPDDGRRESILASYRRVAAEPFFIPVFMDFRGRVYTRPNLVTYQGRDLQKSLMCFPNETRFKGESISSSSIRATVLHASALYGGPDKLDKGTWEERWAWWCSGAVKLATESAVAGDWDDPKLQDLLSGADAPLQLLTALTLQAPGQSDRLACQIDGTCNGLQHLSALFRDDTAAPYVNLVGASLQERPRDIYGEVAQRVLARLVQVDEPWARRLRVAITIDRKLCKKPVMVLPYGGTRTTIEDAVLEAILEQGPSKHIWTAGVNDDDGHTPWADWAAGDYAAFMSRELKDHPLFHLDCRRLGGLVWDAIVDILPKPMAAMQAFRDIAKAVGERTLEWQVGCGGENPLWVVQAKAKSAASPLHMKGLHLPDSVRGLKIRPGRDEIDGHAHVSGIVANFIHSQDAAHQTRTMERFSRAGRKSFGAIFDCYLTRPSTMGLLGSHTRAAFEAQYKADPLNQPVRMKFPSRAHGVTLEEFPSWYALADSLGVAFPECGKWRPEEVLESAWFFS